MVWLPDGPTRVPGTGVHDARRGMTTDRPKVAVQRPIYEAKETPGWATQRKMLVLRAAGVGAGVEGGRVERGVENAWKNAKTR